MNVKLVAIMIGVFVIFITITVVFLSLSPHNTVQTLSAQTGYYRTQVGNICIQKGPGGGTSWAGSC